MKILTYVVAGYLLLLGAAHAQTTGFLHCVDSEFDGRFELVQLEMAPSVLDPTVLYPNLASYSSCQRTLRTLGECTGQGDLCSCQDHDGDGRFGVVKYPRPATNRVVLQANVGNYQGCEARRRGVRDTGTQYHTCEDYDEDGRFGIVRHNVAPILQPAILARPDYGTYQDCTMFTRTFDGCRGDSLCLCVDDDDDGRFSIFIQPDRYVGIDYLDPNAGNYPACFARQGWPYWERSYLR